MEEDPIDTSDDDVSIDFIRLSSGSLLDKTARIHRSSLNVSFNIALSSPTLVLIIVGRF